MSTSRDLSIEIDTIFYKVKETPKEDRKKYLETIKDQLTAIQNNLLTKKEFFINDSSLLLTLYTLVDILEDTSFSQSFAKAIIDNKRLNINLFKELFKYANNAEMAARFASLFSLQDYLDITKKTDDATYFLSNPTKVKDTGVIPKDIRAAYIVETLKLFVELTVTLNDVVNNVKKFSDPAEKLSYLNAIKTKLPDILKNHYNSATLLQYPPLKEFLKEIPEATEDNPNTFFPDLFTLMKENNIIVNYSQFSNFHYLLPETQKKSFLEIYDIDARVNAVSSDEDIKNFYKWDSDQNNRVEFLNKIERRYESLTTDYDAFARLRDTLPKDKKEEYVKKVAHLLPGITKEIAHFTAFLKYLPIELRDSYFDAVVEKKPVIIFMLENYNRSVEARRSLKMDEITKTISLLADINNMLKLIPSRKDIILSDATITEFADAELGTYSIKEFLKYIGDDTAKRDKFIETIILNGVFNNAYIFDESEGNQLIKTLSVKGQENVINTMINNTNNATDLVDNLSILPKTMKPNYIIAMQMKLVSLTKTPSDAKMIMEIAELPLSLKQEYSKLMTEKFSLTSKSSNKEFKLDEAEQGFQTKYLQPVQTKLLNHVLTIQDSLLAELKKAAKEVSQIPEIAQAKVFNKQVAQFEAQLNNKKKNSKSLSDYEYIAEMSVLTNKLYDDYKEASSSRGHSLKAIERYKVQLDTTNACLIVMATGSADYVPYLKAGLKENEILEAQLTLMNSRSSKKVFENFPVRQADPSERLDALDNYTSSPGVSTILKLANEGRSIFASKIPNIANDIKETLASYKAEKAANLPDPPSA